MRMIGLGLKIIHDYAPSLADIKYSAWLCFGMGFVHQTNIIFADEGMKIKQKAM